MRDHADDHGRAAPTPAGFATRALHAGVLPGTVRLSVGLEELADLQADVEGALRAARG